MPKTSCLSSSPLKVKKVDPKIDMTGKATTITGTQDPASGVPPIVFLSVSAFPLLWTEWQDQVANQVASRQGRDCCTHSQGVSREPHGSILGMRTPPPPLRPESASQPGARPTRPPPRALPCETGKTHLAEFPARAVWPTGPYSIPSAFLERKGWVFMGQV